MTKMNGRLRRRCFNAVNLLESEHFVFEHEASEIRQAIEEAE